MIERIRAMGNGKVLCAVVNVNHKALGTVGP